MSTIPPVLVELSTQYTTQPEVLCDALVRASVFRVGLGVAGATIVSGSCARPSHSRISHLLTSSLSIGISSLFCRVTQCM
jgi:hypothetical protein